MDFKKPRGTRDFLFDEMEERKYVENTIRSVVESYGFKEIKTPIFEDLELFTTRSGEGIKDELYHFQDKGGRDLALRPEITASVARLYNNNLQREAKPLKMYYFGSCFRYERPQAGRYRQFWQFGIEVIGGTPIYNEAEIIAMANDALSKINIQNYEIAIGHLGIIKGVLSKINIPSEIQTQIIASIDKQDYELLDKLLTDNNVTEEYKTIINDLINVKGSREDLEAFKSTLKNIPESYEAAEELNNILETLEVFGFNDYTVNLSIARGLDYYTGLVFEIYVPDLGAEKQITGGGTYNLMGLFDAEEVESTGFAFGFDRIMEAYKRQNIQLPENDSPRVLVIPVKKEFKNEAILIAQQLRRENIIADIDLKGKKLKKNLSYANTHKFNKVIMIGQKEVEDNAVTLKDMASGDQVTIPQDELITKIQE
ncbi:histidine--tRNA ligase [Methanosphaera sp. Vir-13MRS]|uniref:histidine--tRNA ligase n=1 Tax=Candidatus Methanosphaera massiliense TaxID=3017187 RepID=UPI00238047C3|nr:histidine--tRNA ligase [Candidatus Methanosphaera massiliense]MDE4078922.1 histidine--tRNA ligase [Candidatus Methanosphaera massiliense]